MNREYYFSSLCILVKCLIWRNRFKFRKIPVAILSLKTPGSGSKIRLSKNRAFLLPLLVRINVNRVFAPNDTNIYQQLIQCLVIVDTNSSLKF